MKFYLDKFILYGAVIFHCILNCASINADLKFQLIGEGFHRIFNYQIDIHGLNASDCAIAVRVSLPPDIYANVDEIADLKRIGKALACSVGEIDVELFAERAESQNVTICEGLKYSKSISLSLPIHGRYKFSQDNGGYVSVDIPKPKLLIGCKTRLKDHRVSKIDICSPCSELSNKWREIPYRMEPVDEVWKMPVGNLSRLNMVSWITLSVTSLGAVVVLRILLKLRKHINTEIKGE